MVSKVPSALLEIEPNQDSTDLRKGQHLFSETAPLSFPAYLSKAVVEVSRKKFHCLPAQLYFIFFTYLSSLLATMEGHYFFFYLQQNWGICSAEEGGIMCWFFFFPTTAFYGQDDLQPLLYAEQHSTIHCIYKTSHSSHFRALGFFSL